MEMLLNLFRENFNCRLAWKEPLVRCDMQETASHHSPFLPHGATHLTASAQRSFSCHFRIFSGAKFAYNEYVGAKFTSIWLMAYINVMISA